MNICSVKFVVEGNEVMDYVIWINEVPTAGQAVTKQTNFDILDRLYIIMEKN